MTYSKFSPHPEEKNISSISKIVVKSPIGPIVVAAQHGKIISVGRGSASSLPRVLRENAGILSTAQKEILEYFSGKRKSFSVNLHKCGTPFQRDVWAAMARIPYGQTKSYADLARSVGRPKAARAIGQACNKNPFLILVPCHRVISSDGKLGGFALGLSAKKRLLTIEKS